ncbi:MAG: hypothetical protein GY789_09495 [Hyphomicrobiales bacterium]|nr:hypothetical protein [Hyphomicrobiales bacterium]MCP4998649.1 hypothetical protein [Hyphomicrobiales bacterium]
MVGYEPLFCGLSSSWPSRLCGSFGGFYALFFQLIPHAARRGDTILLRFQGAFFVFSFSPKLFERALDVQVMQFHARLNIVDKINLLLVSVFGWSTGIVCCLGIRWELKVLKVAMLLRKFPANQYPKI